MGARARARTARDSTQQSMPTFRQRRITRFLLDKNNVECNRLRNEEFQIQKDGLLI